MATVLWSYYEETSITGKDNGWKKWNASEKEENSTGDGLTQSRRSWLLVYRT